MRKTSCMFLWAHVHSATFKAIGHLLWFWHGLKVAKKWWGRVIQTDLVTWPSKVGGRYLHIMCKRDDNINISHFAALHSAVFSYLRKSSGGGGAFVGARVDVWILKLRVRPRSGKIHKFELSEACMYFTTRCWASLAITTLSIVHTVASPRFPNLYGQPVGPPQWRGSPRR